MMVVTIEGKSKPESLSSIGHLAVFGIFASE